MKKKMFSSVLAAALALTLVGCGGEEAAPQAPDTPDSAETGAPEASQKAESFSFEVETADNFGLTINDNMADVVAKLGEPQSYYEAASCAFDGLDKTYTYPGFVVTTRPEGENDFINSIRLTDDSVVTPEGAYIGCTAEEVIAAYGEGEASDTVINYDLGDTTLQFLLENGVVVSVEYLPAA